MGSAYFCGSLGNKTRQNKRSPCTQIRRAYLGSHKLGIAGYDRRTALNLDFGVHVVEFIHMHEPVLKHSLSNDRGAFRTEQQRHHL
ncbi:hypothetical protein D3C76_1439850 [compost metagenome]